MNMCYIEMYINGCVVYKCVCVCVSVFVGHVSDGVEDPVHLGAPASMMSVVHLFGKILQCLLLALL